MQIKNHAADFILNGQPAFAIAESELVDSMSRVNMHSVTANPNVFARNLPSVFTTSPSATDFTADLFPSFRANNVYNVRDRESPVELLMPLTTASPIAADLCLSL